MDVTTIEEFEKFIKTDVRLATVELKKLKDQSRKHVQKLVYTNMVDRFDTMIDTALLNNSLGGPLLEDALKKLETPMSEAAVIRLLLSGDGAKSIVQDRVRGVLRDSVLRNRHSKKLQKLLEVMVPSEKVWNEPRVNISTGKILKAYTPQQKKVPTSICGYADYLYSRRNAIVHGAGGANMLENDLNQLRSMFKADPAKTFKLKFAALEIASEFYLGVVEMIKPQPVT